MMKKFCRHKHNERGSASVEMSILAALIAINVIAAAVPTGEAIRDLVCKGVGAVTWAGSPSLEFNANDWSWDEDAGECDQGDLW